MRYCPISAECNIDGFWVHYSVNLEVGRYVADIGYFAYKVLEDFDLDGIDYLNADNHEQECFDFDN